jgi:Leucine-rich repeat (LRR) protein
MLDLGQNSLESIYPGTFSKLGILSFLNVSFNLLSKLDNSTFFGLNNLKRLDLSLNRLQFTDGPGVFSNLPTLEILSLGSSA